MQTSSTSNINGHHHLHNHHAGVTHHINVNRSQVRGRLTDHIKSLLTHRYLVILASFLTNGIIFGVINSFGVLYVYLHKLFENETKDAALQTSLVGSILLGTTFACSALSSIITDKCGIRSTSFIGGVLAALGMFTSSFSTSIYQLYLTYGLLLGFGVSLCYAPSLVILGHYFTENLGLVNGIVTAGSSVFTMILPICLQQLLNRFSLHFALRMLSLLISLLMVCALTFKEKHEYVNSSSNQHQRSGSNTEQYPIVNNSHHSDHNHQTNHSHSRVYNSSQATASSASASSYSSSVSSRKRYLINYAIWKNPLYILWVISVPTALFGYFVPHFHLVKHASDILPGSNNELLVTCIGATSGIGRLVFGQISDIQSVNPVVLQQIALLALGGSTMLFTVAKSYILLMILCAIFGLFDGCFVSLIGPVAYSLVGKEGASQAIGFVLGLSSIPFMVGPPLAGYLYDLNGDYFYAFLLAGLPPFIGALIMIPIIAIQRKNSSTRRQLAIKSELSKGDDCSSTVTQSTQVDPLTRSLIANDANHLNHHQQQQQPNHLSQYHSNHLNHQQITNSQSHHLHHHLANHQLNFNLNNNNNDINSNSKSNNSEVTNWIEDDSNSNCPENVSLLNKSTTQPTVIISESNDQ